MGLPDTSWVLGIGSRGLCLLSLGTQYTGRQTANRPTDICGLCLMLRGDVRDTHCWGESPLMTGDQQRPLGRMTFELPPKGGKGARLEDQGKKQGRALQAEGTAYGDTLRTESLDYRGNRKVASMTALWVPERAGTEAGRCWSQTSRASWGGIGIEKVLSR